MPPDRVPSAFERLQSVRLWHPSAILLFARRKPFCLALLLVTLLGGAARLYHLNEKSLWSDEIATIATSRGNAVDPDAYRFSGRLFDPLQPVPASVYLEKATHRETKTPVPPALLSLGRIAKVLRGNVHPPLFFYLMSVWMSFFGPEHALSPTLLRLPAALAGIISIPAIYAVARTASQQIGGISSQWFSLLSATFFAFSAYQIDHAQDARPYTLLLLLALLAAWLVIGPLAGSSPRRRYWLALMLTLAAGLYTQYFFGLFAIFILTFLLARITLAVSVNAEEQRIKWLSLRYWCYTVGGLVFLFAPWAPFFSAQTEFFRQAGHYTAGLWKPWHLPEKLWRILCGFFMPPSSWGKILPLVIVPLSLVSWLFFRRRQSHWLSQTPVARYWRFPWLFKMGVSGMSVFLLLWFVVLLFGQIGLDLVKHTHTSTIRRYLFLLSPACYLLMAHALIGLACWMKRPWGVLLSAGFTAAMLTFMTQDTVDMLFYRHESSDEFKQAAHHINHFYRPDDLVLVNKSGAMAVGMAYYLNPDTLMLGLDTPSPVALRKGRPLLAKVDRVIQGRKRVWLVFSHSAPSSERRLIARMEHAGYQWEGWRKFPGVKVIQWRRRESPDSNPANLELKKAKQWAD